MSKAGKFIFLGGILLLVIQLNSCNRDKEQKPSDRYLLSYDTKTNLSKEAIQAFLVNYGFSDLVSSARYDITIYTVTYKTSLNGHTITASGVIAIPAQIQTNLPILGAYRGTIFSHSEAPSKQPLISGYEIFSTLGFVTIMPDMIGFGSSEQYIHPYYNYQLTSACAYDMIRAGEEFMKKLDLTSNGKLFLYGYSEGGYIATAAQKAIESDNTTGLTLTAVATGAGSYDPVDVMDDIVSRGIFTSPSYLAFIVYSYKNYYNWSNPLSDFFNHPYDEIIPGLLDGSHFSSEINSQLNDTLSVLFQSAYLTSIKNGTETLLTGALGQNRVDHWAPQTLTRIYHSRNDQYIPFSDSEKTASEMQSLGGKVELIEIPGNSHEEAGIEMIRAALPWLDSLSGI